MYILGQKKKLTVNGIDLRKVSQGVDRMQDVYFFWDVGSLEDTTFSILKFNDSRDFERAFFGILFLLDKYFKRNLM